MFIDAERSEKTGIVTHTFRQSVLEEFHTVALVSSHESDRNSCVKKKKRDVLKKRCYRERKRERNPSSPPHSRPVGV